MNRRPGRCKVCRGPSDGRSHCSARCFLRADRKQRGNLTLDAMEPARFSRDEDLLKIVKEAHDANPV